MVSNTAGDFNDMACRWLGNDQVRLAVTTDRGPRVVFWGWHDGQNLFAELPGAAMDTPNGTLHFLGGHRLWYAPELLDRTYWPDNAPVKVTEIAEGVAFTAPADGVGIVKTIALQVAARDPEVRVTHTLRNTGQETVPLAPWAISMCRTGGVALLPQPQEKSDPQGFWPNRSFSFWPYTDVTDARLMLGNQFTLVRATPGPNNKVGYLNVHGWFAYWLDGTLFTTHFDPQLQGEHPDQNCNAEFYFAQDVIELETLAPLVQLAPGDQVSHAEVWRLHAVSSPVQTEEDAVTLARALHL